MSFSQLFKDDAPKPTDGFLVCGGDDLGKRRRLLLVLVREVLATAILETTTGVVGEVFITATGEVIAGGVEVDNVEHIGG